MPERPRLDSEIYQLSIDAATAYAKAEILAFELDRTMNELHYLVTTQDRIKVQAADEEESTDGQRAGP